MRPSVTKMTLFARRQRLRDKLRRATRRIGDFCDEVFDGGAGDTSGKRQMREVERVLKRDVPRYLKGLPIPRDYAAIQSLTLREWLYLLPLLLVVAGLARISFYFILLLIFLMFLINA